MPEQKSTAKKIPRASSSPEPAKPAEPQDPKKSTVVAFLTAVVAAFVCGITAYIFLQQQIDGRVNDAFKRIPPAKGLRIYSGNVGTQGSMGENAKGAHVDLKDAAGKPLFQGIPTVVVGFTSLDITTGTTNPAFANDVQGVTPAINRSTLRIGTGASNIQPDGFDVSFYTWVDGRVHGCGVSWIAYGE